MSLFERLLQSASTRASIPFEVVFADGRRLSAGAGEPAFRLVFKHRRAQRRIALFGHIGLLESYFSGDVDVEGDFAATFRLALQSGFDRPQALVRVRNRWHEFRLGNRSIQQAKDNARFHYGLGREFYRVWLDDPLMMYTCGYWAEGTTTLEAAQRAKVEHVCRKVGLKPGERVIDIGCGFGGFMFHAADHHGVQVTGLNTTTEQVEELRERIEAGGYGGRLSVVERDFREVFDRFDKVVSIGTLEHAGRDQLREVVQAHADFLKPGGLGMLHFIGHVGRFETEFFIRKYVFPGGWIPSLAETIEAMEASGLEVVDIENLRRHYALTLDAWTERFESRWSTIQAIDPQRFDERFRRIWRTYLVACAEMFRSPAGHTHLFQIVFSKGNITRANYPMARRFLYESGQGIVETPVGAAASPASAADPSSAATPEARPRPHREPVPSRRLD
jgi:cyclopropane-fatty-acyl-phospholipid synthase